MRSTRITVLGIVVFLFLPILSGCLRINLGGKPGYNIDEDSVFFSKMPPRTENGANIVAFEFDGKPYVFPKEGMRGSLFLPPHWVCEIGKKDSVNREFYWRAWRDKKRYNKNMSSFRVEISEEVLNKKSFSAKGLLALGGWASKDEYMRFEITKNIPSEGLICGRFSGMLKRKSEDGTYVYQKVENGFFDLRYTISNNMF